MWKAELHACQVKARIAYTTHVCGQAWLLTDTVHNVREILGLLKLRNTVQSSLEQRCSSMRCQVLSRGMVRAWSSYMGMLGSGAAAMCPVALRAPEHPPQCIVTCINPVSTRRAGQALVHIPQIRQVLRFVNWQCEASSLRRYTSLCSRAAGFSSSAGHVLWMHECVVVLSGHAKKAGKKSCQGGARSTNLQAKATAPAQQRHRTSSGPASGCTCLPRLAAPGCTCLPHPAAPCPVRPLPRSSASHGHQPSPSAAAAVVAVVVAAAVVAATSAAPGGSWLAACRVAAFAQPPDVACRKTSRGCRRQAAAAGLAAAAAGAAHAAVAAAAAAMAAAAATCVAEPAAAVPHADAAAAAAASAAAAPAAALVAAAAGTPAAAASWPRPCR
eukprot:349707-Chlamydomonas_euryale.AAC.11